ncbi:MAG: hypothetical protein COX62_02310 [Deltaproteobacteria bacterium CG_4_10_14_0_2_um_filter_43_8]|nr:MAG: hypothetical protein COV43_07660 [Deltaproteobacteria bacterium CG11_big_fil_rev_8_21_14_0_20_42_23]PJA21474.1 MAG: hypothetical protein COX62_02310 [Deltaproteobacteria bacterium CG_4_10_14_0_2_um_filter_43_8]PJC63339.1 MAG: hypothetical protein CO021_10025 [Deltaproteobacteria bacterium CG_4_9_14_0_2_um_filter_42_21]
MRNIVAIHGITGSKLNFRHFEEILEPSDHFYSFDLIGFGEEEKPECDYNVDCFLEHISKRIDELVPEGETFLLLAHSMGCILAKEYALRYPKRVQGLVFVNYPFDSKKHLYRSWLSKSFLTESTWGKLLCRSRSVWKYFFLPFFYLAEPEYFDSFLSSFNHTFYSVLSSLQHVVLEDDVKTIKKLKPKAVFISGEKDPFLDLDLFQKTENHILIPDMGHLFFRHEEKIVEIVNTFFPRGKK